jgi:membrane protein required for colicin V production
LLSQVIAGFGLFVTSLVVLTILTGMLARLVHFSGLTPIDRTLGFIFGLVRGMFVVCLAYLLLDVSVQPNDRPAWIREAKSGPYLQQGADVLRNLLPDSLKAKGSAAFDDAIKTLSPEAEAKKAMDALAHPTPAPQPPPSTTSPAATSPAPAAQPAPPPPPTRPAYKPNDQKQLNRLIGTQQ